MECRITGDMRLLRGKQRRPSASHRLLGWVLPFLTPLPSPTPFSSLPLLAFLHPFPPGLSPPSFIFVWLKNKSNMNKRMSKSNGDAPGICLLCTATAQTLLLASVHRPEVSTQIQAKGRAVQTSASLRHLAFSLTKYP